MAKTIIQSILYLFGLDSNPIPEYQHRSDADCIADDWKTVGNDLRNAMSYYEKQ